LPEHRVKARPAAAAATRVARPVARAPGHRQRVRGGASARLVPALRLLQQARVAARLAPPLARLAALKELHLAVQIGHGGQARAVVVVTVQVGAVAVVILVGLLVGLLLRQFLARACSGGSGVG